MGKMVENPRHHIVSFRVTDEEHEALKATANAFNMNLTDVARNRVVGANCVRCSGCGDAA